jgi:hypothetical protein
VANLWTKFTAFDCYAMGPNVKICKNLNKTLVAATYSKAKTYVFARPGIRDHEVGGSNPLAPTINSHFIKYLQPPVLAACFLVVADLWQVLSRYLHLERCS